MACINEPFQEDINGYGTYTVVFDDADLLNDKYQPMSVAYSFFCWIYFPYLLLRQQSFSIRAF